MLLGAALVASGLVVLPAPARAETPPAAPAAGGGITAPDPVGAAAARQVPLPPAAPAAPAAPPAVTPRPAVTPLSPVEQARGRAQAGKAPVVVAELTSDRSVTTAQPDGTLTTEVSAGPVRFQDPAGAWQPIDLELVAAGGRLRPRAAALSAPRLLAQAGPAAGPVVEVGAGAQVFAWGPQGAGSAAAVTSRPAGPAAAGRVRYPGLLPGGRDLQLDVTAGGVRESVVLPDRAGALTAPSYTDVFTVPAGATARQAAGGVEFVDPAGVVVASFGGGHAYDSAPSDSAEPAQTAVTTRVAAQAGRQVTVTVGIDPVWLADPARVFPVTIDPEFYSNTTGPGGTDAYIDAANPTTGEGSYDPGVLKLGTRPGGATETLLGFGLPVELTQQDNNVLSGTLTVFNDYSYACPSSTMPAVQVTGNAGPWAAGSVTWNNAPPTAGPVTSARFAYGYSSACPRDYATIDIAPIAQAWSYRTLAPNGLRLRAENTNQLGYKRLLPAESGSGVAPAVRISWEPCTTFTGGPNGPHKVCGAIRDTYLALGGPNQLGLPTTDEGTTPDGVGKFNHFAHGSTEDTSIYWHPSVGANVVKGAIRARWAQLGWEGGLGYPAGDEAGTPDGQGKYNHFLKPGLAAQSTDGWNASIYYHPSYGAWDVQGAVRAKWAETGFENGLGYPTTGETTPPDGAGRYNHFREPGGEHSIYWTGATGAHTVKGAIRQAWAAQGWESGWLGYPTTDELVVAGGYRSQFQGGNITYDSRSGQTTAGAGVVANPTEFQRITQRRTQLKAIARVGPKDYDGVNFQWRPYSLTPEGGWATVPVADLRTSTEGAVTGSLLPVSNEAADAGPNGPAGTVKASLKYTWNATSTIPADGLVQVRALFHGIDGATRATAPTQVTVDRAGLTGANATSDVGPGTVGLLTGAYSVLGRDADVTAPHGGLAATRSFQSNDPNRDGPVGKGWRLSLAVDEGGADYAGLTDRGDTVLITRDDGTELPFVRTAPNSDSYVADGEAVTEGMRLAFVAGTAPAASSYELVDLDGDKVVFSRSDGGTGHGSTATPLPFRVSRVEAIRGKTETPAVTTVTYTAAGNPSTLVAPTDDGAACPQPDAAGVPAGCRALQFRYVAGSNPERLASIVLRATGAVAPTGGTVTADTASATAQVSLANYSYDTGGRLTGVTDPRSNLTVGYSYDSDGRLAAVTPPGAKSAWQLTYTAPTGALPRLSRATLTDTSGSGLPPQVSTVLYDLPRDRTDNSLPTLTLDAVKTWGQTSSPPTDLTAVFAPADDPAPGGAVPTASTLTAQQWHGAQLSALDVNGRVVNTASFGGTVDQDTGNDQTPTWRINTTEYDPAGRGNTIRTLSAGNRDRALAATPTTGQTLQDAQLAQAAVLDTRTVYSPDGVDVLRSYGPARPVTLAAGGSPVWARARTTTAYDTGIEPGHPLPATTLHLPVLVSSDSVPAASSTDDPAVPALDGVRTVRNAYVDDNSWRFAVPVRTITNPGGGAPDQITVNRVDNQGRTISSTLPAANGVETTAATTRSSYYTASLPAGGDPACVKPEWAGWACKTTPAAAPSAGYTIPTSQVTGYDIYGHPTRTVETGQDGTSRTNTVSYDPAGRPISTTVVGAGPEIGQALPASTSTYDPATGQPTVTSVPGGTASNGTGTITRGYDAYGRQIAYTDATGSSSTISYDAAGRLSKVRGAHGSRTISYDENGERGSLPTSIVDSGTDSTTGTGVGAGTFTARYGADGSLVKQGYPGAISAVTVTDAAGSPASLRYLKTPGGGTATEWLRSTNTMTGFDQVDTADTIAATGTAGITRGTSSRYSYDSTGRLTRTTDTVPGQVGPCARSYTLDANSNRTGLTQTGPAGSCPDSVKATDNYSYDTADRLQPSGTRTALRYDRFGRTRLLPSTDTVDGGGDLTIDYYLNDLVASQTQTGRTSSYSLDPALRRTVRTDTSTGNPTPAVTTNHYDEDTDNPDWTTDPDGGWTRNTTGFGDLAATVSSTGSITLQLANLHGDITATLPVTASSPNDLQLQETTEYGLPRSKPAAGTMPARYGYLGAAQRDSSTPGGLTLMGVRLYAPTLGRFLTVDPVAGGSANDYDYVSADPINAFDYAGTWSWRKALKVTVAVGGFFAAAACGASIVCGVAVGAAAGFAYYSASNAGTSRFSTQGAVRATVIGAALGGGEARLNRFGHIGHGNEFKLPRKGRFGLGKWFKARKGSRWFTRVPHFHWGKTNKIRKLHKPWERG